jgi:hypothetical protein
LSQELFSSLPGNPLPQQVGNNNSAAKAEAGWLGVGGTQATAKTEYRRRQARIA